MRGMVRLTACGAMLSATIAMILLPASEPLAQSTSIVGSWRGNGRAVESDGTSYRVRCKLSINVLKGRQYRLRGKCTSTKGVTDGEGSVTKRSANSYAGSIEGLTNSETGRITIRAGKGSLSIRLNGARGRLTASMRKSGGG